MEIKYQQTHWKEKIMPDFESHKKITEKRLYNKLTEKKLYRIVQYQISYIKGANPHMY